MTRLSTSTLASLCVLTLTLGVAWAAEHAPNKPAETAPAMRQGMPGMMEHPPMDDMAKKRASGWKAIMHAVAVLTPTEGSTVHGVVHFDQEKDSLRIVAEIQGLTPNQKHGFHIHEFGDLTSTDGSCAGGHYNPQDQPHGMPDAPQHHAGDLGNLQADDQGKAHLELTVTDLTVAGRINPILGRGLVIHAQPDDGSQPTGNAGARLAVGVIGIAHQTMDKPAEKPTDNSTPRK
ncbi:MAG: superoxide dismutase family protein [Phycisphaeraceae bacterium]|nr:superoxide dismutase family protein [Phycisphaeraceae bacterium]